MTKLEPHLNYSDARCQQFYNTIKAQGSMHRWAIIKSLNVSIDMFQREYTTYLAQYPQIKYNAKEKEFIFDP